VKGAWPCQLPCPAFVLRVACCRALEKDLRVVLLGSGSMGIRFGLMEPKPLTTGHNSSTFVASLLCIEFELAIVHLFVSPSSRHRA
jgi:hypothetical protein